MWVRSAETGHKQTYSEARTDSKQIFQKEITLFTQSKILLNSNDSRK